MEPGRGFAPLSTALMAGVLELSLPRQIWWREEDLNPYPQCPQRTTGMLLLSLSLRNMVARRRLDTPINEPDARRVQLHYLALNWQTTQDLNPNLNVLETRMLH